MAVSDELHELINALEVSPEIPKLFKRDINTYLSGLNDEFEATLGRAFMYRHTRQLDQFLTHMYKYALYTHFGNYLPLTTQIPLVLCALGSYGREQLSVHSDVDLMIVFQEVPGYNMQPLIESILYTAWDSGLKLGHRVHEVSELQECAHQDITIRSAMMESRFICGSKTLWFDVQAHLNRIRKARQKEFVLAKFKEYTTRLEKNPLCMEPDIKEGRGGIRDSNTLYWIARTLFNVKMIKELEGRIFPEEEYREFRQSLEFLFRIRSALHLSAGKKQDRLISELIPSISPKLGFSHSNPHKAHMQCASKTLEAMETVHIFCRTYIIKLVRNFQFDSRNLSPLRRVRAFHDYAPYYLFDSVMYTPLKHQTMGLSAFLDFLHTLPDASYKIDSRFYYMAKQVRHPARAETRHIQKFHALFKRKHLHPILKLLLDSGLLEILCSSFRKIRHLPQFDGYHQKPVDYHTVACFYHMEHIQNDFIRNLYDTLSGDSRALLKLVLLFHDIGKGRNSDHHVIGERLFVRYCKYLKMSPEQVELGAKLIRFHTLMSNTAHREDIYSEHTIVFFASRVQNKETLDLLYILTYADIKGVGEDILTHFLQKLLYELYHNTLAAFDKDNLLTEAARRLRREDSLVRSHGFKTLPHSLQKKVHAIPANLFFLKLKNEEIITILKKAHEINEYDYKVHNDNYLQIEIIKKVPMNLGYFLGKLASMNIASMDIFKLFDEVKYFRIEFHEKSFEEDVHYLGELIEESFDFSKKVKLESPDILKKEIVLNENHSQNFAEIKIHTHDSKGLLAFITKVFDEYGIEISSAKLHTQKHRVRDLFLIEKNANFWNNKESIISSLIGK